MLKIKTNNYHSMSRPSQDGRQSSDRSCHPGRSVSCPHKAVSHTPLRWLSMPPGSRALSMIYAGSPEDLMGILKEPQERHCAPVDSWWSANRPRSPHSRKIARTFRAGSAVMESLNLGRMRKSRVAAGYERRLRRSNGDSRGRQRVITRIITKMFIREHRHFFDLPVFR